MCNGNPVTERNRRRWLPWLPAGARRPIRIVCGILSLIVGVAGVILPILHGILFLLLGALLLSPEVPAFDRMLRWGDRRFPAIMRRIERFRPRHDDR